jgi:hypothetical protein
MKQLDVDNVFEEDDLEVYTPPAKPGALERSEAGARWDLPEESFLRWWRALPEEDRAEFVGVYGGDNILARFVCALDYLTVMQARPQTGATICEAFAIAAGLPTDSQAARQGALQAWEHDSVQALVDRLRYRSNRQAAARITNRTTAVIEAMLREAETGNLKEKESAAKTALQFMRMVSDEDVQERVERTRRGFVKAREALGTGKNEYENITPEQALLHLKVIRDQLGSEKWHDLLANVDAEK